VTFFSFFQLTFPINIYEEVDIAGGRIESFEEIKEEFFKEREDFDKLSSSNSQRFFDNLCIDQVLFLFLLFFLFLLEFS